MLPEINRTQCIGCLQCVGVCPMGVLGKGEDGKPSHLPRRRCIGCMHCAAICPQKAVSFAGIGAEELYVPPSEDALETLVKRRRSVRKFKSTLPDKAVIQWALDTAEYAPSGKNVHATRWTVLWGQEATHRVTEMVLALCRETGEAPELPKLYNYGTNLITCGAPCVIIGWSPEDCLNPVVDTAVAMTTLELLLASKGIATCWGGYLNQIANHNKSLRDALGLPENCRMRCALMVGYPDGEHYRHIPYRPKANALWLEEQNLPQMGGTQHDN